MVRAQFIKEVLMANGLAALQLGMMRRVIKRRKVCMELVKQKWLKS